MYYHVFYVILLHCYHSSRIFLLNLAQYTPLCTIHQILYIFYHFIWFYGQNYKFMLVLSLIQQNKLKIVGLISLYNVVCLICKALHNSHCFTSVISFQHRATSLHHKSPISNLQLVFSHVFACAIGHTS